jgi:hypothetical protein
MLNIELLHIEKVLNSFLYGIFIMHFIFTRLSRIKLSLSLINIYNIMI